MINYESLELEITHKLFFLNTLHQVRQRHRIRPSTDAKSLERVRLYTLGDMWLTQRWDFSSSISAVQRGEKDSKGGTFDELLGFDRQDQGFTVSRGLNGVRPVGEAGECRLRRLSSPGKFQLGITQKAPYSAWRKLSPAEAGAVHTK